MLLPATVSPQIQHFSSVLATAHFRHVQMMNGLLILTVAGEPGRATQEYDRSRGG